MKYIPHPYQRYAIEYIKSHREVAVLLDMGLGKTSICLTALQELIMDEFDCHRVLVVAPLRVARSTWPDEIGKWDHLKELRYSVIVGSEEERLMALSTRADLYIVNRENLQWLIERSGTPFDYDTLVIDELSSFKNHQAKRTRALMKVRLNLKRVIGLTGTPSSNGLMDLWAEYRILDMGKRLGRYLTRYRLQYFQPDRRNGQVVFSYRPLPGAEELIYEKIADMTISMKSTDYLEMPEKIVTEYPVRLSDSEMDTYRELRDNLLIGEKEVTASNSGVLAGKLLQLANGAVYSDEGRVVEIHSRKLEALEDIVESANGKPMLLAYWFRHDRERIIGCLSSLGVVFEELDSVESINRWNRGELQVGIIHPASAGHGLNLQQGGSTIVWYGLTWSLELYQQTNARLWRQGQKEGTVVIQHIVTKGTIDERVLKALEEKERVQDALIEAVRAEIGSSRGEGVGKSMEVMNAH